MLCVRRQQPSVASFRLLSVSRNNGSDDDGDGDAALSSSRGLCIMCVHDTSFAHNSKDAIRVFEQFDDFIAQTSPPRERCGKTKIRLHNEQQNVCRIIRFKRIRTKKYVRTRHTCGVCVFIYGRLHVRRFFCIRSERYRWWINENKRIRRDVKRRDRSAAENPKRRPDARRNILYYYYYYNTGSLTSNTEIISKHWPTHRRVSLRTWRIRDSNYV